MGNISRKNILRYLVWLVPIAVLAQAALVRQGQVLAWPNIGVEFGPADSDVWLRLTQVRQFLTGGDFFDHTVRNTNAPTGGISTHWTRPMDFLLSLFYYFTPTGLDMTRRLLLSATLLPPVMGLACFGVLQAAVQRRFNNVHALWILLFLLASSPLPSYFPPGECDHHGLLSLLWCGIICLLMRPLKNAEAWLLGALSGLMIWISTEGLMLYPLTLAILGAGALKRPEETKPLFYVTLSAALVAALGLIVEVPLDQIFAFRKNDTLSIVYVMLLSLIAAAACLLSCPVMTKMPPPRRMTFAVLAGAAVLGIEIALFPRVVLGPLADADPYVTREFFARVMESKHLFAQTWLTVMQHLWQPVLALVLLFATWRTNLLPLRRRQSLTLLALLGGTLMMTLEQGRWTYYLQPPALIAIAGILPGWAVAIKAKWWRRQLDKPFRPYTALLLAGILAVILALPSKATGDNNLWNCQSQLRYIIQTQQLQRLIGKSEKTIYVPAEEGGDVLFFTPYRIIAGEYHREGQGLKDLATIEEAKDPDEARRLLKDRGVDSMIVCPVFAKPDSWMRGLTPNRHPAWLTPVTGLQYMQLPGPKPFLFNVK